MNILYLHGFQSSAKSETVSYLKSKLNKYNFYCFDLPHKPEEAIKFISDKIKQLKIDIIIGTSLGGLYAYNFEMPRICINPAFQFNIKVGHYKYFNKRQNGETEFDITEEDVEYLHALTESYKSKYPVNSLFYTSYIVIGKQDNYVSFDKLNQYTNKYDHIIYKDFEHRLSHNIIDTVIAGLVERLERSINSIKESNLHE